MKEAANDNEPLSFITLAAATANVVRYLQTNKKQDEQSDPDADRGSADQQRKDREREYIEHRLKELRAWERQVSRLRKDRA